MNIFTIPGGYLPIARGLLACCFFAFVLSPAAAQGQPCPQPTPVTVTYACDGAVVLDWPAPAPGSTVQSYTVDIEQGGQPVVDFVNMQESALNVSPGTLQPGTDYSYAVTANCGASSVASAVGMISGAQIQSRLPEIVISAVNDPLCPNDDNSGSFAVTVLDDCGATYDIIAAGETFLGVPAGTAIVAGNLSASPQGTAYNVSLSLAANGGCTFAPACIATLSETVQLVPTDALPPAFSILGPGGAAIDGQGQTFSYSLPEGECGVQLVWSVFPEDNCSTPGSISFGATIGNPFPQADPSVVASQTAANTAYSLEIFAAVGANTLTLTATDEQGNQRTSVYTIEVDDTLAPVFSGPGEVAVQIPACQSEGVPVYYTVAATDNCDLDVSVSLLSGPASGDVLLPGNYMASFEAIDDAGNSSIYNLPISVGQVSSPAPVVDVSGNYTAHLTACNVEAAVFFSGNVYDCTLSEGDDVSGQIVLTGAPLSISHIQVFNGFAYFEAEGQLLPGEYLITTEYAGTTVASTLIVEQAVNQPAVFQAPGQLNVLQPLCASSASASFNLRLTDDCDVDFSAAAFTLNGSPVAPSPFSDPAAGLFTFQLQELLAGTHLFEARYTDGGGLLAQQALNIQVSAQADLMPPVIVYPAQDIQVALDPCGPSVGEATFQVTAIDNCSGVLVPNVAISGSAAYTVSGNNYTVAGAANAGPHLVTITATDAAGNMATETFRISFTQSAAPEANLACNDEINVTLSSACQRVITADMVLEGSFGCLENSDFTVLIVNDDNPSNGNILDGDGQFIFDVSLNGAPIPGFEGCWGYIRGEDKTAPVLTCPPDNPVDLLANAFDIIYGGNAGSAAQQTAFIQGTYPTLGAPAAVDNCGGQVAISATDVYTEASCGNIVITRTFRAVDEEGNAAQCQQQITLRRPQLEEVVFPAQVVEIECSTPFSALSNGLPAPQVTGIPVVPSVYGDYQVAPSLGNLAAVYEDTPRIDICEGTFKFSRRWTVYDWCLPGSSEAFTQLVKVGDFTAPAVTCPQNSPLTYSTSPFACTAALAVPMPTVSDNCSGVAVLTQIVTVTEEEIYNQYGLPTGQLAYDTVVVRTIQPGASRFVSGIPFGQHFFRYIASDDCGNATTLYCPFEVVDNIEPVAVCDDQLNVSIGGGNIMPGQPAVARVFAEDVDEGSWDNCGPVDVAIFRDNFNAAANTCGSGASPTGSYVDFFCCDVGVTVSVTLVVTDQHGNQNTCWLSVTPEDKIRPFCEAPANVNVGCDDLPHGFDPADPAQLEGLFGMASGADNCGIASVQQVAANASLECRAGSITRVFRVADVHGNLSQNTCVQVINIQEVHNYEIFFPADTDYACGEEAAPAEVAYNEIGCDLLAVSSTDEQFSASGQECYKIFRTWKVINWCEYDGESNPLIISRDEDCDGTPGNRNLWLLARENGTIFYDADQNELGGLPGPNACGISSRYYSTDNYTADSRPGFYQYTQIIKVYDDTAPAVSFVQASPFCSLNNTTCSASVVYPFAVTEDCTPGDLSIRVFLNAFNAGTFTELPASALSGGYPNYSISGTYPIGAHAFRVVVRDGCGNSAQAQLPFEVIDCKAPAPVCINGIAVELMPVDQNGDNLPDAGEGMAEIWASDFIASAITDCTGPVKYAINRAGEPNDPDQDGLALTCADLGTLVIEIWAYDGAGNGDFCETYLLVQDNQGICGSGAPSAAGAVHTRGQQPVENVTVSISGQGSTTAVTSAAGQYAFEGLQPGLDYTLTPQRDGDYLNGVSTFDLVLISKHILGIQPLASPYQLIAADVNNSRSITTLDMIQLRKLILSVDTEFSNNDSWRFVDASYVFPNPANPWLAPFPEGINLNNLPLSGVTAADFIAVKIGDVSGDAVASSLVGGIEERSTATFVLRAADASLRAGEEYSVVVSAPGLAGIEGYQATLALSSAAELLGIKGGIASEEHFGFAHASEGLITTSWNGEATEGVLFTLMIRATEDAQLSEILGVSSAIAKAEAYGKDGSFQDVAIEFSNGTAAAGFEVYQNQPNPFRGETVIGFDLPEAASATVTVSDITGKVLKVYHINGVAGYNAIAIDAGAFPAKGVLAYTVKTGSFSVARKMMVID